MDVSIVIPTKNGGSVLDKVLSAIENQKTIFSYEVICVDSGSSDNTIEIINSHKCKLFCIEPKDFGHGKTRNFGAFKGIGEFIVFLTQDAVPATDDWLQNFISAMKSNDEIVGGFGRHIPYDGCNIFDDRDIRLMFEGFGTENTIYYMDDPERYKIEEGYRHLLAYFSDNNSCVRRSIFEKYPYADVNFSEDQIWAKQMIELGYKKLYCPSAPVYHSHNYPLKTYFKRYFDEYKGLYKVHNYIISKNLFSAMYLAFRLFLSDVKYVRSQPLSKKGKIKWICYSFVRNNFRCIGGYLGGSYHSYSKGFKKFLDKHISQQYNQIKE